MFIAFDNPPPIVIPGNWKDVGIVVRSTDRQTDAGQRGERLSRLRTAVTRSLFGDRDGLTLFLGSLALFVLSWRIGTFFNDVELYVAMLERLSEGHLSLGAPGELDGAYPGMHHADGQVYGRSFGLVAAALPLLWLLELVDPLVDLRALFVVGWSLLLLATAARVGSDVGRRRRGIAVGGTIAVAALAANAWFYGPFVGDLKTVALQLSTMLAAAVTVVFVYRLLAFRHGSRVGVLGGVTALVGTPVAFWATVPKRHTLVAMFVVVAVYAFARSRDAAGSEPRKQTFLRALAYVCAGLLAWVSGPEAFTLLAALAVADLATGARNDVRTLAVVSIAFALSLVPFLVTNTLVSGNPLLPPHFMDSFRPGMAAELTDGGSVTTGSADASGSSTGGSDASGPSGGFVFLGPVASELSPVAALLRRGIGMYVSGFLALFTEPSRVYRTFVRWGASDHVPRNIFFDGRTNLSVLESAPVLAALVALPLRRRVRAVRAGTLRLRDAVDPVDLLVVVYAALLVCLYINRLPVFVQGTVRYLHPLYPLAVYGLFRLAHVRQLLTTRTRSAVLGYEVTVLLGTPLTFAALLVVDTSKGDVVQTFGLVSLVVATVLAVAVIASRRDERLAALAAAAFGAAVGLATLYLLLTAFLLMHFGPSALPFFETVSGEYRWLTLT